MSRVKIIGGGLTGILAAFQAHAMGADDIELHERFDHLGGVSMPEVRQGLEMREGCIYFGPSADPIRRLLETHGAEFYEFENRFGSVSAGSDGLTYVEDFGGPALPARGFALTPPAGPSLADRIACYPSELQAALTRYGGWHLGADLAQVHGEAAIPLAINRIYPTGVDLQALAEAKRTDALANELLAIPRALWGHTNNLSASLPVGGFPALIRQCRRGLEAIGVRIHEHDPVSPRQAFASHAADDVLVWAANPTPLFKAAGVATPRLLPKSFSTYVFEADWTGPLPFYAQNFTAQGACFRVYIYETAGRTLLTAECVREADATLGAEIQSLLKGFAGVLVLGDLLAEATKPRWIYHTVEAIDRLADLRRVLTERMGPAFVPGAWEPYAKAEKFHAVDSALAAALKRDRSQVAA